MSKDKSGKAQDILLESISETTLQTCVLGLLSEQKAQSWRLWQVQCPCTDTTAITGIYNTHTDSQGSSPPAQYQEEHNSLSPPGMHTPLAWSYLALHALDHH